ncbi:hypothetical protein VTO73DRAFT_9310 [Trametes versicolor]
MTISIDVPPPPTPALLLFRLFPFWVYVGCSVVCFRLSSLASSSPSLRPVPYPVRSPDPDPVDGRTCPRPLEPSWACPVWIPAG